MSPKPSDPARFATEELLFDPPADAAEFERRTADVDAESLRDELWSRIRKGEVDLLDAREIGRMFRWLEPGEYGDELRHVAAADSAPNPVRESAVLVLAGIDPSADGTFGLEPGVYRSLVASIHEKFVQVAAENPDIAEEIAGLALRGPEDHRGPLLEELEAAREAASVEAGLLYRPLLERDRFRQIWPSLLDALEEAGGAGDARWLRRLAGELDDEEMASRFEAVADRLPDEATAPQGRAFVGSPDGTAAAPLFLFVGDDEEPLRGYHLVLRWADHSIGEGYFLPNVVDEEVEKILEEFESSHPTRTTETSVGIAVRLAHRFIDESDQPVGELPSSVRSVVHRLDRMPGGDASLPEVEAADSVSGEEISALFEEEDWLESWFFEEAMLERLGVDPVPGESDGDAEAWRDSAAETLAGDEGVRRRVVAMFRAAATWFELEGRSDAAGGFAALADQVETEGVSDAARAFAPILETTVDARREFRRRARAVAEKRLGDETLRRRLSRLHLEDGTESSLSEETLLDFMEFAHSVLDELRGEPKVGGDQPDIVAAAAGPVGRTLARALVAGELEGDRQMEENLVDELTGRGIDPRLAETLAPELASEARLLAAAVGE